LLVLWIVVVLKNTVGNSDGLLALLLEQDLLDVGKDAPGSNGDPAEQLVQLLVIANSKLESGIVTKGGLERTPCRRHGGRPSATSNFTGPELTAYKRYPPSTVGRRLHVNLGLPNAIYRSTTPDAASTPSLKPDAGASIDKRHEPVRVLPLAATPPQPTTADGRAVHKLAAGPDGRPSRGPRGRSDPAEPSTGGRASMLRWLRAGRAAKHPKPANGGRTEAG